MITILNNQPIRFRTDSQIAEDNENCQCIGHDYCQLIEKHDETQFQIKQSNSVANGDFDNDLMDWNIFEAIIISIDSMTLPDEDICDGSIDISAIGGAPAYEYSIDGGPYQVSTTFSGLCQGYHFITVKDSLGNEGTLDFDLAVAINCADFAGSTTDDLLPYITDQFLNCNTDDLI